MSECFATVDLDGNIFRGEKNGATHYISGSIDDKAIAVGCEARAFICVTMG